jgi:hypothetical protein
MMLWMIASALVASALLTSALNTPAQHTHMVLYTRTLYYTIEVQNTTDRLKCTQTDLGAFSSTTAIRSS